MKLHVSKLAATCFYQLRRIRQIRRVISQEVAAQMVHALVISKLDYCNGVLAGLPTVTIAPLLRVQNAARPICTESETQRSRDTGLEAAALASGALANTI